MSGQLHHKFAKLHQSLLHDKLPRSLHWSDVVDLIGHLGQVQAHGGDEFAFVVGARREVFKKPHTPEIGVEEVSRLRKFLKLAGSESPPEKFNQPRRIVAVIDHHAAHIFRDLGESGPQDAATITPYDPTITIAIWFIARRLTTRAIVSPKKHPFMRRWRLPWYLRTKSSSLDMEAAKVVR
jgi:hypothetical protein